MSNSKVWVPPLFSSVVERGNLGKVSSTLLLGDGRGSGGWRFVCEGRGFFLFPPSIGLNENDCVPSTVHSECPVLDFNHTHDRSTNDSETRLLSPLFLFGKFQITTELYTWSY